VLLGNAFVGIILLLAAELSYMCIVFDIHMYFYFVYDTQQKIHLRAFLFVG